MNKPSDLVQGTLDMLLLRILALEPTIGFAVRQRLKECNDIQDPAPPAPFRKGSAALNLRFAPASLQMLLLAWSAKLNPQC